jgi:purine-binding chemotaxis protein CheW
MAIENQTNVRADLAGRYLAFSLGAESFAVPLLSVREVIAMPEVTPVPHTPAHFLGIMNLRGQIISVIDLRTKFKFKTQSTQSDETAVVICNLNGVTLGVVVDSVNYVLTVDSKQIQDKPQIERSVKSEYILGVTQKDDKLVLLVDLAQALDVSDYTAAKAA